MCPRYDPYTDKQYNPNIHYLIYVKKYEKGNRSIRIEANLWIQDALTKALAVVEREDSGIEVFPGGQFTAHRTERGYFHRT